jgi:hypothetical protein
MPTNWRSDAESNQEAWSQQIAEAQEIYEACTLVPNWKDSPVTLLATIWLVHKCLINKHTSLLCNGINNISESFTA